MPHKLTENKKRNHFEASSFILSNNNERLLNQIVTCEKVCMLSHFGPVCPFATLWTITCQVPLSMWFSRQEYWNGLPFPPSGDLPKPGIEPASLTFPALSGRALVMCQKSGFYSWRQPAQWLGKEAPTHFPKPLKWRSLSRVWLFATSSTMQSLEFSRPEYWSG